MIGETLVVVLGLGLMAVLGVFLCRLHTPYLPQIGGVLRRN